MSFFSRLVLAFRVLFDKTLAARLVEPPALPEPPPPAAPAAPAEPDLSPAFILLAMLQREGRFVDFVQQDIASFPDADVGAAARVVHEGCRRALLGHAEIVPVASQAEGETVTLEAGYDADAYKLIGDVSGSGPHTGKLRHRGWRAAKLSLPRSVGDHDTRVLAPAEVEI